MQQDTIVAIATPFGKSGVGVLRISGPQAAELLGRLFQSKRGLAVAEWQSHHLYLGKLYDEAGCLLDTALAVLMRAPHSYTGEDVAEFQTHGGMRLLQHALDATLACGARLATPGEFTLRAFLNGKLDLSQAEAVLDIIEAKTPSAAQLAAAQLEGKLSRRVAEIEAQVRGILARITVAVDFPDDADAPLPEELQALLAAAEQAIAELLATAGTGRVLREGLRTALVGAVNVGKSSLLNQLLGTERAIVAGQPGTTRDVIEETLDLDGLPLLLIDTAGFRAPDLADEVERIGMARSRQALDMAQLVLLVIDAQRGLDAEATRLLAETQGRPRLLILNKCDVADEAMLASLEDALRSAAPGEEPLRLSALTGDGVAALSQAVRRCLALGAEQDASAAMLSNARQQQAVLRAQQALAEASAALAAGQEPDLVAIDVENALSALGEISGRSASEQVLEEIFSRFCLGK